MWHSTLRYRRKFGAYTRGREAFSALALTLWRCGKPAGLPAGSPIRLRAHRRALELQLRVSMPRTVVDKRLWISFWGTKHEREYKRLAPGWSRQRS